MVLFQTLAADFESLGFSFEKWNNGNPSVAVGIAPNTDRQAWFLTKDSFEDFSKSEILLIETYFEASRVFSLTEVTSYLYDEDMHTTDESDRHVAPRLYFNVNI